MRSAEQAKNELRNVYYNGTFYIVRRMSDGILAISAWQGSGVTPDNDARHDFYQNR
jgi:hypothetical protein